MAKSKNDKNTTAIRTPRSKANAANENKPEGALQAPPANAENTNEGVDAESNIEIVDTPSNDDVVDTPNSNDVVDTPNDNDEIDKEPDEILEMLSAYVAAYPNEKVFHVTSDKQVFLHTNKRDADAHQTHLNKSEFTKGELKSYEV